METETISEILVGVSTVCICLALWLKYRQEKAWHRLQDQAIKELEDNWSQYVQ